MRTLFAIAAFAAAANAIKLAQDDPAPAAPASDDIHSQFLAFLAEQGKSYSNSTEFQERQDLFADTAKWIDQANLEGGSATFGHNFFSDMTQEEKDAIFASADAITAAIAAADEDSDGEASDGEASDDDSTDLAQKGKVVAPKGSGGSGQSEIIPSAAGIDWRTKGAVNPIKDQGQCGSCWTFASNAQMEGLWQIATGTLYSLAEQQLVDCATDGNSGCNGGFMTNVYNFYSNSKAMMSEASYPYKGVDGSCSYSASSATPVKTKSNGKINHRWKEQDWKDALNTGIVSIAVSAGNRYFQNYKSGILDTTKCPNSTDHAVAMIGWGQDPSSGAQYWIVRNSWGTSWGEDGYIRVAVKSKGNGVCMVQSTPVTVTMDSS